MLRLLDGISEPLRLSRRLCKFAHATQKIVDIFLDEDAAAMPFEQNRAQLTEMQGRALAMCSERVEKYFEGFPSCAESLNVIQDGSEQLLSLGNYEPPAGLRVQECAVFLLAGFINEAHELALKERSQHKYVKTVASLAMQRWLDRFIDNVLKIEHGCALEICQTVATLLKAPIFAKRLKACQNWGKELENLMNVSVEAVACGCFSRMTTGILQVCDTTAALKCGLGAAITSGLSGKCSEDSPSAKAVGAWNHTEAKKNALQIVLDICNSPEFQLKAKELVLQDFERRLKSCMDKFADFRDPHLVAASREAARDSIALQAKIADIQRSVDCWFFHFANQQICRDPWLIPPPNALHAALPAYFTKNPSGMHAHEYGAGARLPADTLETISNHS